jgi:hypothetical protein
MADYGFRAARHIVRLDFFKPRGKWKYTEELDMKEFWIFGPTCVDAVEAAINHDQRLKRMHREFTAVVLEPYHCQGYPVMLPHTDPNAWSEGHD